MLILPPNCVVTKACRKLPLYQKKLILNWVVYLPKKVVYFLILFLAARETKDNFFLSTLYPL